MLMLNQNKILNVKYGKIEVKPLKKYKEFKDDDETI